MSDTNVADSGSCPTTKGAQQANGFLQSSQMATRELPLPMPHGLGITCNVNTNSTSNVCQMKTTGFALMQTDAYNERLTQKPSCGA